MVMSVSATRCDTEAAWLLATWSSGMISVDGAGAAPVLLGGSAAGRLSRPGSRWQADVTVTSATMAAIRIESPDIRSRSIESMQHLPLRLRTNSLGPHHHGSEQPSVPAARG